MNFDEGTTSRNDAGLTFLRVVAGVIFMMHGAQKLFTFGLPGVTQGFAGMGVPMPEVAAPLVAVLEFAGGIALVLGLLTRLVSIGLACDMMGAMLLVHLPKGFFSPEGVEFVLLLFACAITFAIVGASRYSVDEVLARRRALK